jgi:prepilin-type N-terminal cleavage/methylation domain-containing protein
MSKIYSRKNNIKRKTNLVCGFTLIETLTVIFIFSILVLGISELSKVIFKDIKQNMSSLGDLDNARAVASNFTNEIRTASYGNDGGYPLYQVNNSQIIFYSNYGQSNGIVAKIRYFLVDDTLKKGIIIPTGSPLNYNSSLEKIITIQDDITNGNTPIFYYYNGNYEGSSSTSPLSQPVNVNQVKYILIKMNILKENTNLSDDAFTVSAGASIRNLKTNL